MASCTRRSFLAASMLALGTSCATPQRRTAAPRAAQPNIVVILADDMGVGDVKALWPQGKIDTPNLDRFVAQGMSFTDAHSGSAVCTPTRYGLLTGRYAWRTCLQNWVIDTYEPPLLAEDRLTLPQMLKDSGYHTACIGKWHLGCNWKGEGVARDFKLDITAPIEDGPTTRGFDYYFGTDVPNFPPYTFIENGKYVIPPTGKYELIKGIHVGFEGAPIAPDWKFEEILPSLTQRAVEHIQEQARKADPFFLFFSMTSPHEPLTPSEAFQGKSGIAPIADFIMETDWSAGQVLQALEDAGVAEDTLVIFATDNGHSHYTGWELLVQAGHAPSGPWRGHKGDIYEGGHRVPFVVRWPGVVAPGSQCSEMVCLNDLMATFSAVQGRTLPEDAAEDSVNLLPLFQGNRRGPIRESLVNHDVKGNFAYREGPWKLIVFRGNDAEAARFELYNLETDPAEAHDLSQQEAPRVKSMLGNLQNTVDRGRSTPGAQQQNDTLEIDVLKAPAQRWAKPIHPQPLDARRGPNRPA